MIGLPFNDQACLSAVTEVVAELVSTRNAAILEIASRYPTIEQLAEYIRSLPQRDDTGEAADGPRVGTCDPPQRLRIPADDPNCVERAALYISVAEFIDGEAVRQLATLDTPIGMHTFPIENGAPIILDPRVPRNCLDCGVQFLTQSPMVLDPREAIDWTAQLADAGAAPVRNGPSRVRRARNAIVALVDEGAAPADLETFDSIGWMLSLAERVARRYGPRALAVVRTTAMAVAELADEALARVPRRNLGLEIGGRTIRPAPWVSMFAKIAGRVGMNIGAVALDAKLKSLGIGGDMVGLVEDELNREGLTLGVVAKPPKLPTFERLFTRPA